MFDRKLLVTTLALLAAAGSACSRDNPAPDQVVVATVNGEPLRAGAILAAARADALGDTPEILRAILEEQIDRRLLVRAAEARRIRVSDEDLERAFQRLRADYPDESFAELLRDQGIDEATFRENLRQTLMVQRLLVDEVVARVALTEDEIAAWLESHPPAEEQPERVRAAQIVVATEEEARSLRERLIAGESFEELARAHSLSPDGKKGGDLGFFARGEMPPTFEEVCFGLRPGEISEAVSSSYGFHVFKVLERREARPPDPLDRRREAERSLRRTKEAAAQRAFLARLRQGAQIDVDEAALARLVGK